MGLGLQNKKVKAFKKFQILERMLNWQNFQKEKNQPKPTKCTQQYKVPSHFSF